MIRFTAGVVFAAGLMRVYASAHETPMLKAAPSNIKVSSNDRRLRDPKSVRPVLEKIFLFVAGKKPNVDLDPN